MKKGDRVRALTTVTEDGSGKGDPSLKEFHSEGKFHGAYIHAHPGDEGVVVHTEPGSWPTVRFDRTGTSTCVRWDSPDPQTPLVVAPPEIESL